MQAVERLKSEEFTWFKVATNMKRIACYVGFTWSVWADECTVKNAEINLTLKENGILLLIWLSQALIIFIPDHGELWNIQFEFEFKMKVIEKIILA